MSRRWSAAALSVLFVMLAIQACAAILNAPSFVWNEIRLARSLAIWHGWSLYPGCNPAGPVIGTMHTPVSHFIYLILAGFHSPTDALLAGSCLSMLLVFVPLAWALRCTPDRWVSAAAAFLFCGFLIVGTPGTYHIAFMIHTDAAALAFTTLACGIFCNPRLEITVAQAWLAGAACVLAVGSKQTMLPIVLAIALFLVIAAPARLLVHFTAALLVTGALLLAAILNMAPMRDFLFNTVTLAAHRPLKDGYFELLVRSYRDGKLDALPALFPIFVLGAGQWMLARRRPTLREFVRSNRWIVFALAAAVLIPVTVKAIITVGSDVNHPGMVLYLLFVAAGLAIAQFWSDPDPFLQGTAWICAAIGILSSVAPGAALTVTSRLRDVHRNAPESALRYELRYPGRAYFPLNPMAGLLAHGKAYHVDPSIYDRESAGYPLSERQFEAGLPADFREVAIPPGGQAESRALRGMVAHLMRANAPELPGWTVYERR